MIIEFDWNSLLPADFEFLIFDLLKELGFKNCQPYGQKGHDKGRDIVCLSTEEPLPGFLVTKKWVVQCKKRSDFPSKVEIDREISAAKEHNPDYWLLCTTAMPTSDRLDYLHSFDNKCNFKIICLEKANLENILRKYPDITDRYFIQQHNHVSLKTIDTTDGELAYDNKNNSLYKVIRHNNAIEYSELEKEPDKDQEGKKLAFVFPYEWEVIGNVFIYNTKNDGLEKLTNYDFPDQYTPKDVWWIDNDKLIILIGHAYGTVTVGGDLFIMDILTNKLLPIYQCEPQDEVMDIVINNKDQCLTLKIAKHDDEYISYKIYKKNLDLKNILEILQIEMESSPFIGKWLPEK